ncbi:MAG TPA: acyltransferase domain-containing protein [Methylovirgula sp.]|nr:acyltransferase domain-containing protein [Methylovirgula sp.]
MSLLYLCSGQGTQHPAMFARLAAEAEAQPVLNALSRRLGFDARTLETQTEIDLSDNLIAQLLVTGHALAVRAVLADVPPELCVGYSVGEIAACAGAGAFDAETAFDLIAARALCMNDAAAMRGVKQSMLAVIGLSEANLRSMTATAGAEIAIVNGTDHFVLGGPSESLDALEPQLAAKGARTLRRLPVQVASHTSLLAAAGPAFARVLDGIGWATPNVPVLSGIDGRIIRSKSDAVRALSEQLWRPLNFRLCLESAAEHGATAALEIGAGRTLTRLYEEVFPEQPARAYEDFRTAAGTVKWARRHI